MTHPQTTDAEDTNADDHSGTDSKTQHARRGDDSGSDLEQVVASRSDAVERGEGGSEPGPMTDPGEYSGVSGDGGAVKNQDMTAQ